MAAAAAVAVKRKRERELKQRQEKREKQLDDWFDKFDTDNSGTIQPQEFIAYCTGGGLRRPPLWRKRMATAFLRGPSR